MDGVVSFGLIPWLVVDLAWLLACLWWFPWLPVPGLWAGSWFVSLVSGLLACFLVSWFVCWPVCGVWFLVCFSLPGMWAWLFWLVCGLAFGCYVRADAPLPMFIGEVLSVCCFVWWLQPLCSS